MGSDGLLVFLVSEVITGTALVAVEEGKVAVASSCARDGLQWVGTEGWRAITAPLGAFLVHRSPVSRVLANDRSKCSRSPRFCPMRGLPQMEATVVSMQRGVRFDLWLRCVGKLRLASLAGS